MTARAKTLRDAIIAAIHADRANLVVTNFEMTMTTGSHVGEASNFHLPEIKAEDLSPEGRVWVIALVGDQSPAMSRNYGCIESIPIQVCYQCRFSNLKDADFFDVRIELCEQLKKTLRVSSPNWCTWMRTEATKDDNGTPHDYVIMREDSIFMCVFTGYYETYLEANE
jgi:hypothetical protein